MTPLHGFIFIDANQYLNLYSVIKGKKLLNTLIEQKEHIFITAQIVDEVQRNKLRIAKQFLDQHFDSLDVNKFNVPDRLFDVSESTSDSLHNAIDPIVANISQIEKVLKLATSETIDRISKSEDEVSKSLSVIFSKATEHTPTEFERARMRKEKGNPPGKHTDVLGDQLNWEQLLSYYKTNQKMWFITGDSDFRLKYDGKFILNPFLYQELSRIANGAPEVYCFDNIDKGIRHFVEMTGVSAKKLPTAQESETIQDEWDSANNVVSTSTSVMSSTDRLKMLDSYQDLYVWAKNKTASFYSSSDQQRTPLPLFEPGEPKSPKKQ